MQSKGGGKARYLVCGAGDRDHDRISVDERDPDADMCPGTATAPVSTELGVRYRLRWWPIQLWRRQARVVAAAASAR